MNYIGTSENNYVKILELGASTNECLNAVGGVKNTGLLNSLSVRITATNFYTMQSVTETYILALGSTFNFSTHESYLIGLQGPYSYFKVEVKSTVTGLHTGFNGVLTGM
jgi:hypothetical protein